MIPPMGIHLTRTLPPLLLLLFLLLLPPLLVAAPSGAGAQDASPSGGRLYYGGDARDRDGGPLAAPDAGWPRSPFVGPGSGYEGPPADPPPDIPPPPSGRPAPELTGNAWNIYAFQEIPAEELAGYVDAVEDLPLEERIRTHVGLTLSAWVKIGTDGEFDRAARDTVHGAEAIAANNRLVVAFEQFAPDGRRLTGRVAKFGFEVDLFGHVYPCIADPGEPDGPAAMLAGTVPAERQEAPDFPEITACATVLDQPVRRLCVVPPYKFEYLPEARERETAPAFPTARLLQRWKRLFIHFHPAVGTEGLLPHPRTAGEPPPRYAVMVYPKTPDAPGLPRASLFVDGAMFQISRHPTRWTPDKSFYLGPNRDHDGDTVRDTTLLPIHSEIPYETK